MKLSVAACVLFVFVAVSARPDDKYSTKYDNVNIDDIIKSDRLLRNYIDCLMETKKCTSDGEELKKVLTEAIETKCAKCNDVQKEGATKVLHHLLKNKKDWWNEIEAKYDPNHTYTTNFAQELKDAGITV